MVDVIFHPVRIAVFSALFFFLTMHYPSGLDLPWGKGSSTTVWYTLLFIPLVIVALWLRTRVLDFLRRVYQTKWWDVGLAAPDQPLTWADVFELASLDLAEDPVVKSERPKQRSKAVAGALIWFLVYVLIGVAVAVLLNFVLYGKVPDVLATALGGGADASAASGRSTGVSGNAALFAAVVTVYFGFQQLRAKVRADSRQAWINEVRKLLALSISEIGSYLSGRTFDAERRQAMNERRLQLELHLNPSEKDHRLLMLLIRACIIPGASIMGDRHVRDQIKRSIPDVERRGGLLWEIVDKGGVPEGDTEENTKDNRDKAMSYIVKLSHVVLKREWERVRYAR